MNRLVVLALVAGIAAAAPAATDAHPKVIHRTYLIPHFIEKPGTVETTPFTVDTFVMAVYTAGLPQGSGPSNGRHLAIDDALWYLYLYADDDSLLRSGTGREVCNPCAFALSSSQRKQTIRLDDLIVAAGGFDAPAPGTAPGVKLGYAIVTVSNDDANVSLSVLTAGSGATPTPTPESLCGGSGPAGYLTLLNNTPNPKFP